MHTMIRDIEVRRRTPVWTIYPGYWEWQEDEHHIWHEERRVKGTAPLPEGYPSNNEWQEWISKCKHKETI